MRKNKAFESLSSSPSTPEPFNLGPLHSRGVPNGSAHLSFKEDSTNRGRKGGKRSVKGRNAQVKKKRLRKGEEEEGEEEVKKQSATSTSFLSLSLSPPL